MSSEELLSKAGVRRRIVRTWRAVSADDLLQHGGLMAAATVIAGGFNYGYQVLVGRTLGAELYGVFGALFALFYLLHVVGRGIRFSASRFAAELDGPDERAAFYRGFLVRSVGLSVVSFGGLLAVAPAIAAFLDLDSTLPVVAVAATIASELVLTANQGTLQGLQRFAALGGFKITQACVKFSLGAALVLAGFGLYGAFGAVALASLAVLFASTGYLYWRLGRASEAATTFEYRRAYRYVLPAALAGFCLTVPANADVVLVKHFFAGEAAGHYTAASVLGKILLFLPMGISTALFPKVSADHTAAATDRLDALFDRALAYAALVGVGGAGVYWIAAEPVLRVVFGVEYVAAAPLVRWYGLAMLAVVLSVVVLNFQLARDRMGFVYLYAAGSLVELALIWVLHTSMVHVVQIVLAAHAVLFLAGIALVKLHPEQ